MSGTGQFRNVRNGAWSLSASAAAREHLGDRLAAFVDGELGDDSRERVLSHLATCDLCKAEAEEQRRLKNAVADALPPALSAGLLARLQGLPGCDSGGPGDGQAAARGAFGRGGLGGDVFGPRGDAKSYLTPGGEALDGFPIHDFNRSSSRGRRLVFAAAGAFSLAALALGGALPLDAAFDGGGPPEPAPGTASTPLNMNQADGRRTADPGVTPVSATVTQTLTGGPAGGRPKVASAGTQDIALSPSPSALPAAGPQADGQSAGRVPAVTPSAVSPSPPVLTARSIAPEPMPLLGDLEGTLSAPLPGGHAR